MLFLYFHLKKKWANGLLFLIFWLQVATKATIQCTHNHKAKPLYTRKKVSIQPSKTHTETLVNIQTKSCIQRLHIHTTTLINIQSKACIHRTHIHTATLLHIRTKTQDRGALKGRRMTVWWLRAATYVGSGYLLKILLKDN